MTAADIATVRDALDYYSAGLAQGPATSMRLILAEAALARMEAENTRLREALTECVAYVNGALYSDQPWRVETAQGVMDRVQAALAASRPEETP